MNGTETDNILPRMITENKSEGYTIGNRVFTDGRIMN